MSENENAMRLSELAKQITDHIAEHGDCEVRVIRPERCAADSRPLFEPRPEVYDYNDKFKIITL